MILILSYIKCERGDPFFLFLYFFYIFKYTLLRQARVDKIHVDGLMRTKDDVVKAQVMDLFKAKDFQDVIIRTYKVQEKLEALGCFRRIGIYIDISQGPEATPDGVEVGLYNYTLIRQRISNFSNLNVSQFCVVVTIFHYIIHNYLQYYWIVYCN